MDEDCIHTKVVLGAIHLQEVVLTQSHPVGCSWGPGKESQSNWCKICSALSALQCNFHNPDLLPVSSFPNHLLPKDCQFIIVKFAVCLEKGEEAGELAAEGAGGV